MSGHAEARARQLAKLMREAETAYNAYARNEKHPRDRWQWCAEHMLGSGQWAALFLNSAEEPLRQQSTEAG